MRVMPDFDKIMLLINEHGEPNDCKETDCSICKDIITARKIYNGAEYKERQVQKKLYENRYTVIDQYGKESNFTNLKAVCSFIKTSEKFINIILNKGTSYKGFTVDVEKVNL